MNQILDAIVRVPEPVQSETPEAVIRNYDRVLTAADALILQYVADNEANDEDMLTMRRGFFYTRINDVSYKLGVEWRAYIRLLLEVTLTATVDDVDTFEFSPVWTRVSCAKLQ